MIDFRIDNFFEQLKVTIPSELEFPPIITQYQPANILCTFHWPLIFISWIKGYIDFSNGN